MNARSEPSERGDRDRALVAAMDLRDADALGELYDRHSPRLLGLAYRILGESGEAEEVVQEVFLYAWRAAATFDPSRGSVIAWLLVATRSRAIDRLRARRPTVAPDPRGRDPLADVPAAEDVEGGSASREWESLCRGAI
ncbi:MAG TPA: sigma-70 family RNA polymerase sigma factor, partial [Thermoanaerobaculia bacterium]